MITHADVTKLRSNLDEHLHEVHYRGDSVLIHKDGAPVAALINIKAFNRLHRLQQRFDTLCLSLASGFADIPEPKASAEIVALVASERNRSC